MGEADGRLGGLAGLAAAALLAAALTTLPELPTGSAPAQDVFDFFLEESSRVRAGAALAALAMLLSAGLFAALHLRLAAAGAPGSSAAMLGFALLAIGGGAFAAALLGTLALRPEDADPATSRSLLDLAEAGVAVSGAAFALALGTVALASHRAPGALPGRIAALSLLAAPCLLLWFAHLITDAEALDAGSFLGATLGWLALMAWLVAAGLWVLGAERASGAAGGL